MGSGLFWGVGAGQDAQTGILVRFRMNACSLIASHGRVPACHARRGVAGRLCPANGFDDVKDCTTASLQTNTLALYPERVPAQAPAACPSVQGRCARASDRQSAWTRRPITRA